MDLLRIGCLTDREFKIVKKEIDAVKHKSVQAGIYGKEGTRIDKKVRNSLLYFLDSSISFQTFSTVHSIFIEKYLDTSYKFLNIPSVQYASYRENNHFEWHQDLITQKGGLFRYFTMSINLSEPSNYSGGELEVSLNGKSVFLEKKPGSYICFPSFVYHKAHPVISGHRESLVVWAQATKQEVDKLKIDFFKFNTTSVPKK